MVALNIVRASNARVLAAQPLVAVFVGGTAGIGEYGVRALAAAHNTQGRGLRVYMVGRNARSAAATITACERVCPTGTFRFVQARDLCLLKDVDRCCEEIRRAEEEAATGKWPARVDLLVLTQGVISFAPRNDTEEGFDRIMALLYYGRVRFVRQLLPLLTASPLAGRVVTVANPNMEGNIYADDLSGRDPKHFGFKIFSHVCYFFTFYFEHLAKQYPGKLSLSHYFPGHVVTDLVKNSPLPFWVKWASWLTHPLVLLKAVPNEECGERVVFFTSELYRPLSGKPGKEKSGLNSEKAVSSDGVVGGGAYRVNWNGDIIPNGKAQNDYRAQGIPQKMCQHTDQAFEDIDAGRKFTG